MKRAALLLALLAGCDRQPAGQLPDTRVMAPLPAKVCSQARDALAKLKGKPGIEISGPAEATVEDQIWLQLGAPGRDQLAQLLAYDAACASSNAPREQQVTIRSQFGTVLMQRIVETGVDLSQILDDGEL